MGRPHFVNHLSVVECLGCVQVLVIMNNAAVNTCKLVLVWMFPAPFVYTMWYTVMHGVGFVLFPFFSDLYQHLCRLCWYHPSFLHIFLVCNCFQYNFSFFSSPHVCFYLTEIIF
jgi:hypothetical protein